jgi:hypothetical protein
VGEKGFLCAFFRIGKKRMKAEEPRAETSKWGIGMTEAVKGFSMARNHPMGKDH